MQKLINITLAASVLLVLVACGGSAKEKKGEAGDLKVKLEQLKKDKEGLDAQIRQVEEQLAKVDPSALKQTVKLVTIDTVKAADFSHFIELQGKIDATDIVYVTPRGAPAQVRALHVKRGDRVSKGQLLARLDDAVMQQQMDALKTQLAYAENLYNRQKNLWDQGIGTEVQLITAKNNVDNLKRQMSTMNETLSTLNVYAPISGIANEVNVRVGEIFNGGAPNAPQIQIVNSGSLKMVTEVPENYVARVRKGAPVEVLVPETGKPAYHSKIDVIGASINPNTRAFITEAKLPSDPLLKPNQLATLKILDYKASSAVAVPINIVQTDEKGKYVFVLEKSGDKSVARKKIITVGEAYGGQIEVKSGLTGGEQIITEGYQTLYEGQAVTATR